MKILTAIRLLLASLVLLGSSACKKTDPEAEGLSFVNGVPYYHFTDDDQRWLKTKSGDEWKMVNASGYQRVYRAGIIQTLQGENESTSSGIPGHTKLLNYYDQVTLGISRTDSSRGGGSLRFYRDAAMLTNLNSGGSDRNTSRFYAEGEWYEFVGNTDLISDYYSCRGLKFPNGAALNGPFQQLTVRGRQYNDVVAFIGTSRGSTCGPMPSFYMQELYYDRQAGLVRLVSLAGEVWDRVP